MKIHILDQARKRVSDEVWFKLMSKIYDIVNKQVRTQVHTQVGAQAKEYYGS